MSEFNLYEAAEELTSEADSTAEELPTGENLDQETEGQPEGSQENQDQDLSPEEIMRKLDEEGSEENEGQEAQGFDVAAFNKSLGAIHNGQPIEVESLEQARELIQKGFDYTFKTQQNAEHFKERETEFETRETELKAREEEFGEKEQDYNEHVFENTIVARILEKLKTEDPESFNYFTELYTSETQAYNQLLPFKSEFEGKFKEMEKTIGELRGERQGEELEGIRNEWENGLKDYQTANAARLQKLGVVPDYKKVQEVWKSSADGSMTVEQAVYAVHGKDIQKAFESQNNLLKTKNKTSSNILKRSGLKGGARKEADISATTPGDYMSILRESAS